MRSDISIAATCCLAVRRAAKKGKNRKKKGLGTAMPVAEGEGGGAPEPPAVCLRCPPRILTSSNRTGSRFWGVNAHRRTLLAPSAIFLLVIGKVCCCGASIPSLPRSECTGQLIEAIHVSMVFKDPHMATPSGQFTLHYVKFASQGR